MAPELLAVAELHEQEAALGGKVWDQVSMKEDGLRRFTRPEVRAILSARVRAAREKDAQAVQMLEKLLVRLGSAYTFGVGRQRS
ncbi:MAG: hypothetical protein Q8P50_04020 [Bacillota bacterium]|nr:hypothetical protein [Bacillota bacterium]